MTDRSTLIAGKKQSDRLREKLSTPEGRMQDSLERTLPQSVVADAQKREMWAVHPDVAASSAVFDSVLVLVQTLFLSIGDKAGAKSLGAWFQGGTSALQELDAWCRKLARKALTTDSFNGADKFRAEAPARTQEVLALCLLCHAFHTSRCRDKSLPDELKLGWKLFRRLSALRKELIRIASAASGWHRLFSKNPDMPRYEVRRAMHEAWQSGVYPRGKLNLPWEVWKDDVIDMCAMDSYPQAMPDDLFILSADGGKLALWRATK